MFWLLLGTACTASRLSSLPPAFPQASRLEVGKRLGVDTAGTANLNWPKGRSILHNVMLSCIKGME